MKVLLEIRYLGRDFHGWQVQPGRRTVQQTLQIAYEQLVGQPCGITGCSRTDSGVHALQFFCTAETPCDINLPLERLPVAINTLLPGDIAVLRAKTVDAAFHPRYFAVGKAYEYRIRTDRLPDPFADGLCWHYGRPLDIAAMNAAAGFLVGTHDFTSFCAASSDVEEKVRTIFSLSVIEGKDGAVLRICGDGFLYNMVRIIVGTLVGVSEGKYKPGDIPAIIEAKNRGAAGLTAPACGLYLAGVFYEKEQIR